MASNLVYIAYLTYVGTGAPVDGDIITRDNSTYPLNTMYTDRETGTVYIRKDTSRTASTDWQTRGASETPALQTIFSDLFPEGTAYSYVDLGGNEFEIMNNLPGGGTLGLGCYSDSMMLYTSPNGAGGNYYKIAVRMDGTYITHPGQSEKTISGVSIYDDYADDAAAATGGIQVGELYHTSGTVKIRLV
jgi:hypothetical protein